MTNQKMAQTLGYTSLALGVAEIAAPEFLSSQLGIEKRPKLRAKQGAFAVVGAGGQILKRGHDLRQVLRIFDAKLIRAVEA